MNSMFPIFTGSSIPRNQQHFSQRGLLDKSISDIEEIQTINPIFVPNLPVPDQAPRPTCTAFAAAAMAETIIGDNTFLSREFIYEKMRTDYKYPNLIGWDKGATKLGQARKVLENDGIPKDALCPYDPKRVLDDPNSSISQNAINDASTRKFETLFYYDVDTTPNLGTYQSHSHAIYSHLNNGHPVCAAVAMLFIAPEFVPSNWGITAAELKGTILSKPQHQPNGLQIKLISSHVVCIIGADFNDAGDYQFIFQNSWGNRFAKLAKPPLPMIGYGQMSIDYIDLYAHEILVMTPK